MKIIKFTVHIILPIERYFVLYCNEVDKSKNYLCKCGITEFSIGDVHCMRGFSNVFAILIP